MNQVRKQVRYRIFKPWYIDILEISRLSGNRQDQPEALIMWQQGKSAFLSFVDSNYCAC